MKIFTKTNIFAKRNFEQFRENLLIFASFSLFAKMEKTVFVSTLPWCHKVFQGVIETAGSNPTVSITLLDPLKLHLQIRLIFYNNFLVGFSCLTETAESELCKLLSQKPRRIRSYMRNGFSPWIHALQGGLFDGKKLKVENLVSLSLKIIALKS
jgi:hypothetical protein